MAKKATKTSKKAAAEEPVVKVLTTTRSYEALVMKEHDEACAQAYKRLVGGTAVLLRLWTDLFGGFTPQFLPKSVKEVEETHLDGHGKLVASAQAHAFSLWFHPVWSGSRVAEVCPAHQVQQRFERYWADNRAGCPDDPATWLLLQHITERPREGVDWIDCRKRFQDTGIDPAHVEYLYAHGPFYGVSKMMDGIQSKLWPEAKQTDYDVLMAFYAWLEEWLPSQLGETWSITAEAILSRVTTKPGNWPLWRRTVVAHAGSKAQVTEADITLLRGQVAESSARSGGESKFQVHPWMGAARVAMDKEVGFPYAGNVKTWMMMSKNSLQVYLGWRSNFMRQIAMRRQALCHATAAVEKAAKAPEWLSTLLAEHKSAQCEQDYLTSRQLRGFKALFGEWHTCPSVAERLKAIEDLERFRGKSAIGDKGLLMKIARAMPDGEVKEAYQGVCAILDAETAQAKFAEMRAPVLSWVSEDRPIHPWWGDNKCPGSVELQGRVEALPAVGSTTLRLFFNGEEEKKKDVKVTIVSKRFFREIHTGEGGTTVQRDHRLARQQAGLSDGELASLAAEPSVTVQLLPRKKKKLGGGYEDRWYAKMSVDVQCKRTPKYEEMKAAITSGEGLKVLGIDRGFRNPLAFVLASFGGGPLEVKDAGGKGSVQFAIEELGTLCEHQKRTPGTDPFCRLTGARRSPDLKELALWRHYRTECNRKPGRDPSDHLWLWEDLSGMFADRVRHYVKAGDIYEAVRRMKLHYNEVQELLGGGLSITRMATMRHVISSASSVNSALEDAGMPPSEEATMIREEVTEKLNRVRREAVRVSASLILRKAIACKAQVIAIEELDLGTSQEQSRGSNARLTDWCNRRLLSEVQTQAGLYGLAVQAVSPAGTSTLDFTVPTRLHKPKFTLMAGRDVSPEVITRQLRAGVKGSFRARLIREAWLAKACMHGITATGEALAALSASEDRGKGVYVPATDGAFYHTDRCGWLDSDVTAAAMIARRAAVCLLGYTTGGRDDEEAVEEQEASPKKKKARSYGGLEWLPRCWAAV